MRDVLGKHGGVAEEVRDYAADAVGGLVEDMADDNAEEIAAEMRDTIGPLLEGVLDEDQVDALCKCVARAFKGLPQEEAAASGGPAAAASPATTDYVIQCDNIILAYAGKSLLRSSSLRLARGRRYGLVGQNGVGKSTLLARIHAGDIANFPDITVVLVRQDAAVQHEGSTVIENVVAADAGARTKQEVITLLSDIGFTPQVQSSAVRALSGGWRMKLALVCAMVQNCDVLLLDEPTNHLDTHAVDWLARHLSSAMPHTTVIIVSHDYEFLSKTVTDVVHMENQTLAYYPDGWRSFSAQRPAVVAALPVKENASYFAHVTGEVRKKNN